MGIVKGETYIYIQCNINLWKAVENYVSYYLFSCQKVFRILLFCFGKNNYTEENIYFPKPKCSTMKRFGVVYKFLIIKMK